MPCFAKERSAFQILKRSVETNELLKADLEVALKHLLQRFATSIRENRFVVGGVLEVILTAALRAVSIDAQDVGIQEKRLDIRIPEGGFSVKGHFTLQGDIRLINTLGESTETMWDTATLFVLHRIGIAYADPDLVSGVNAIKRVKDAIVLRYKALREFIQSHPEYLIKIDVPSALDNPSDSELVSRRIAREILQHTPLLKNHY